MILVLGHVTVRPEHFDEVLKLSRQHVERSRAEPGCIAHAVHRDTENPLRLVFVEKWSDMAALQVHFRVPASREFGKALATLASEPAGLEIHEAAEVKLAG
ncbi:antibiotic biosynthesis monooxygenase [Pelomonas sp. Root1217]|uniref:putative quinol monooxygenase n=1 Tax=Pelomonas sp. Root1217 TaxID=1736430 RepID=UPI00070E7FC3|nr:putative quinol monooxygenase [Pelomonas sp. Root1217]KQV50482.1 antibiotic biosynthesis monooxygenase [Pelomonas sp. Root1217]